MRAREKMCNKRSQKEDTGHNHDCAKSPLERKCVNLTGWGPEFRVMNRKSFASHRIESNLVKSHCITLAVASYASLTYHITGNSLRWRSCSPQWLRRTSLWCGYIQELYRKIGLTICIEAETLINRINWTQKCLDKLNTEKKADDKLKGGKKTTTF